MNIKQFEKAWNKAKIMSIDDKELFMRVIYINTAHKGFTNGKIWADKYSFEKIGSYTQVVFWHNGEVIGTFRIKDIFKII